MKTKKNLMTTKPEGGGVKALVTTKKELILNLLHFYQARKYANIKQRNAVSMPLNIMKTTLRKNY